MATAIAGAKADNTTALAITWQGAGEGGAGADMISTQTLHENEVSTTMHAPPLEASGDAFDEEEIEKAIAEIRDAIEKSSQLLK
jgi:protein phosphatase